MSDPDGSSAPRPRQVTLGSGLVLVSCVLLVLSMLDAMSRMRSVETRRSVEEALSSPPGSGLGIDVETVLAALRAMVLLTGGLAAAGVVLAVFALQRHRGARVGLAVIAVVMLFTATFVSGLLPIVVAIGALMLWGRDARGWFTGTPARPDPHAATTSAASSGSTAVPTAYPPPAAPAAPGAAAPPPGHPYGPPPGLQTYGQPPEQPYAAPRSWAARRPLPVIVAAALTWIFSGLTLLFLLLVVVVLLSDQDQLLTALRDNPQIAAADYTARQLLGLMWVVAAVGLFWCLAAIALAVLAYRRVGLGRVGLIASAVAAGVVSAISLVGLVHAVAAFATVVLLLTGSANRWYAGTDAPAAPPRQPGPPPPQAPPPPPTSTGPRRSDGTPKVW